MSKRNLIVIGLCCVLVALLFALPTLAQYQTKIYFDQGGDRMVIQAGGAVVVTPGAAMNMLYYPTAGQAEVCGSTVITGMGALPHGLATPVYVNVSLGADFHEDHAFVTFANTSGTVTAKVWRYNATPAPANTGVPINWCIKGIP
jgi:hypothetical protein